MTKNTISHLSILTTGFIRLFSKHARKSCFLTDRTCSGKMVRAHSIQKRRILRKLAVDGHVEMFGVLNHPHSIGIEPIGVQRATVFSGLCGKHDNDVFHSIEDSSFEASEEQLFKFALRAFLCEYSKKLTVRDAFIEVVRRIEANDLGPYFGQPVIERMRSEPFHGMMRLLRDFHSTACDAGAEVHRFFLTCLRKRQYGRLVTEHFRFPREHGIAVSSSFDLRRDFEGRSLRLKTPGPRIFPLVFLSVFPEEGETHGLFSYAKQDKHQLGRVCEQIGALRREEQRIALSKIILAHCENVAFASGTIRRHELFAKRVERLFNDTLQSEVDLGNLPGLDIFDLDAAVNCQASDEHA